MTQTVIMAKMEAVRARLLMVDPEDEDDGIDPEIIDTLVILNVSGFTTILSCAGHELASGQEEDEYPNSGPYVEIASAFGEELSEDAREARRERYERDALTEADVQLSQEQEIDTLWQQRQLILHLEEFYSRHQPASEAVRLVVSRPSEWINAFTLASQGAWVRYDRAERSEFLEAAQAEMESFTSYLHDKLLAP